MKRQRSRHSPARRSGVLLAMALVLGLPATATAQQRPTMAIMPTQYFSADLPSATHVTQGLVRQFEPQGYQVIPTERSRTTFESMGLSRSRHYPDRTAIQFGRRMGADLVAYPRLLVLGMPAATPRSTDPSWWAPAAVLHLRVLNTRTGKPVYFRQVAHEFEGDRLVGREFTLPQRVALAAADELTRGYFTRVAGSREELSRR